MVGILVRAQLAYSSLARDWWEVLLEFCNIINLLN